jgi:hypothetical protein
VDSVVQDLRQATHGERWGCEDQEDEDCAEESFGGGLPKKSSLWWWRVASCHQRYTMGRELRQFQQPEEWFDQNVEKFARKVAAVWKALGRRTDKLRFDRVKLLRDSFAQELRHRELGSFCTIPQLGKCRIGVTCCGSKIQRVLATVVQFPPADIPRGIS